MPAVADPPTDAIHGVDVSLLDKSVKPDIDLYRFANGVWLDRTVIPADNPEIAAFTEVSLRNEAILKNIVEKAQAQADNASADAEVRKIGAFYRLGMDEARADQLGVKPLTPLLARIDAIKDTEGLFHEFGRLERIGVDAGFDSGPGSDLKDSNRSIFNIGQGGLSLPDRDYYLKDDARSKGIRTTYLVTIGKLLQLAGETPDAAATDANSVLDVETRLAKASRPRAALRDPSARYHPMDLKAVEALAPALPWPAFFKEIKLDKPGVINVTTPEFLPALSSALTDAPLAEWKT